MFWVFVLVSCFFQILHVKWTPFFFSRTYCAVPVIAMFSVFLRFADLLFSAASGPARSVKKYDTCFWSPRLGDRFKTWSHPWLGLCVSDMDYDGSGLTLVSNSNQTNWKSKVGHTWTSVSTWGSCPSFQAVWLHQKHWYLKNAQKDVEFRSECQRMANGWVGSFG